MRFFVYYKFRQKSEVLVIIKKEKKKKKKKRFVHFLKFLFNYFEICNYYYSIKIIIYIYIYIYNFPTSPLDVDLECPELKLNDTSLHLCRGAFNYLTNHPWAHRLILNVHY